MENLKLSHQSMSCLTMALVKSLAEQSDIVEILKDLEFVKNDQGELEVINPPKFQINLNDEEQSEE